MNVMLRKHDHDTLNTSDVSELVANCDRSADWLELKRSVSHVQNLTGSFPGECGVDSLRLACCHLRTALNIAIRLGGEE